MKRYLLRRNRLIDRETGFVHSVPSDLIHILDKRLIEVEKPKPFRSSKPTFVTVHDLPASKRVRIVERYGATKFWVTI